MKNIEYGKIYDIMYLISKERMNNMKRLLRLTSDIIIEAQSGDNPILDENGQFVSPEEAVNNFAKLWEEWDIVNRLIGILPKVILAVAILAFGIWFSRFVANLVVKALKSNNVDAAVYMFIRKIVSVFIKILFVLFAMSIFININSFLAAIGAAGITAGLGLQDSVAQFASGIQILFNRPFKAGDYIEVAGREGFVSEIRFMSTVINTPDNKRVIIPNTHLTTNELVNFSAEDTRRIDLNYSISYSDDIQKAKDVILSIMKKNDKIISDPEPVVYVNSHESSSIDLLARFWCKGTDYWSVYFSMQEEVKLAFDKEGINIPFNQLDVHIINNK